MQSDNNNLKFAIIIPAFNEEKYISDCLISLVEQSLKPSKIIVVDDSSSDDTAEIIKRFELKYDIVNYAYHSSQAKHIPGQKVINTFNIGVNHLDLDNFDVICKFDADLIFPPNYLKDISKNFETDQSIGLCGGVCSLNDNGKWKTENLTNADHIRGALKAYRVKAFKDIGALPAQMGWDTADEFKLRFKRWKIKLITNLSVKHLKPTAASYQDAYFEKQGQVFYALRYGFLLTLIAALKISKQRHQLSRYKVVLKSYQKSKAENLKFLLDREEGQFLRRYRWKQIWRKMIP